VEKGEAMLEEMRDWLWQYGEHVLDWVERVSKTGMLKGDKGWNNREQGELKQFQKFS